MTPLDDAGLLPPPARPALPGGPQTVAGVLQRGVAEHPAKPALVGRHGRFTYSQLDDAVGRAAAVLASLGVQPGARVAATLANDVDVVIAFLATMRLGGIWVGINRPLAAPEKAFMLADAGASVYLAEPSAAEQLAGARHEVPDLEHLVVVDRDGSELWRHMLDAAEPGDAPLHDIDPFAPAAIAYTSGTTGFPKGAVHSQHNLLVPGHVSTRLGTADPDHVLGVALPLTVLNLMILGPLVAYQAGQTLVAMDRIDAVGMAEWIREESIATFSAVPAMIHDLLTNPAVTDDDLRSLVRPGVGGADMPETFRTLYRERFGTAVTTGYGLTEAPTAVTVEDPAGPLLPGSAGRPLPQVEILILDPSGAELPVGEVGEICVRAATSGPFAGIYTPMLGYWKRPEATAEALRGGVLHTKDLGCIGEGGNLFVKDRKADLIIRGGANVYPAEVERVLHADPLVAACAVVGAPDERLGERVVAFVQLAPGTEPGDDVAEVLLGRCARELARYKVPEVVHFVDGFDRTPMGKIRKTALRALVAGAGATTTAV
ncbi:MAG TPA: AMP-binding protein [Acidimicrobiales bacterium]|nr:AMP-binding protein [Acidimicrobiales bacterium]